MHKPSLLISAIIFLIIALVHLYRIISPFPIVIGNTNVPEYVSYIGLIIFGMMAIWDFCGTCCGCCCHACKIRRDDRNMYDRNPNDRNLNDRNLDDRR